MEWFVHHGGRTSPRRCWRYGWAYSDFRADLRYYAPIPLNLVVALAVWVRARWDRLRAGPRPRSYVSGYRDGYYRGYLDAGGSETEAIDRCQLFR